MGLTKALGITLRAAREQQGLSQEDLALDANVQRNHVSRLERGESSPTVRMLDKLCTVLKIPLSVLFAQAEALMNKGKDK